ncbi:MAG: hypothetical protein FJW35_17215 [Acidobacteria bacterium]|nr:hypothetical protein [Acidobacteriota bacterium]
MIRKRRSIALTSSLAAVLLILGFSLVVAGQDKVRVFVTDSHSWEVGSGGVVADDAGFGGGRGGARPQTAEIIKTFGERCSTVTVTNAREKADYVVLLDHEGGKKFFSRDNKVVIFNREGDAIFSGSTRSLGNAVKDVCSAITQDRRGAARP